MGHRGRPLAFLEHWHQRELELAGGDLLRWTFIDDLRHVAPHAECFKIARADGGVRLLHPSEAQALLVEHGHPDAAHVRLDHGGRTVTHPSDSLATMVASRIRLHRESVDHPLLRR